MTIIRTVTLTVHDLSSVTDFYQRFVGLRLLSADGEQAVLGAGNAALLVLRRDAGARRASRREAGLFHTAFLLPDRAGLGRWLHHAGETGMRLQGAADHLVSEALYLADPEGNGVELYADRSAADWTWTDAPLANHAGEAAERQVVMRSDPLDTASLLAAAGDAPWRGMPDATTIGHVHLQVGSIPEAEAFYGGAPGPDGLGLAVTCRYPGATFFSLHGYHHHIATNVWNSRGAPPRTEPSTGLAEIELRINGAAAGVRLDPWAIRLRLTG